MKHALVVGGTGMLAEVSLWLAKNGYHVSVIGRNHKRMEDLMTRFEDPCRSTPLLVDYSDSDELNEKLSFILNENVPIDLILSWIHTYARNALELIVQENSNKDEWTLIHVLGSSSNINEIKRSVNVPEKCIYRQVQLGFILENEHSRWLTNKEIADGIIEAISNDKLVNIVGVLEPWEKRP